MQSTSFALARRSRGFTLVELLVTIALVGVLIALVLPAIQTAREAARRAVCKNHLGQLATAALLHHETLGHFPYGGWGQEWVGVPGRGFGRRQPGGWIYNLLPYLEQGSLRALGASGLAVDYARRIETPLSVLTCPTRRRCQAWPISPRFAYVAAPKPMGHPRLAARGDYAINSGATLASGFRGPESLAEGDSPGYIWLDETLLGDDPSDEFSGVCHVRYAARNCQIADGASNTYLFGEKFLNPDHYENGESIGDNESIHSGYSNDNHRFANVVLPPLRDAPDFPDQHKYYRFGSAHERGINFAFCDGSVDSLGYDISPVIHFRNGHIADRGMPPVR